MKRSSLAGVAFALLVGTAVGTPPSLPAPAAGYARLPELRQAIDPGTVPPVVLAKVRTLLAARLAADQVEASPVLAVAEAVTWPDGSLGCGRAGQFHTQALVPGYRLVYLIGERRYEFHASSSGYVIACDRSAPRGKVPQPMPPGGPPAGASPNT